MDREHFWKNIGKRRLGALINRVWGCNYRGNIFICRAAQMTATRYQRYQTMLHTFRTLNHLEGQSEAWCSVRGNVCTILPKYCIFPQFFDDGATKPLPLKSLICIHLGWDLVKVKAIVFTSHQTTQSTHVPCGLGRSQPKKKDHAHQEINGSSRDKSLDWICSNTLICSDAF